MPTGQTPQAQYKKGNSLAQGEATTANELLAQISPALGAEEDDLYQPQGEEEEFLFSPTDRPNEPITAGAPFGDGPNALRRLPETADQFIGRIASELAQGPASSAEVKAFAARVARGD